MERYFDIYLNAGNSVPVVINANQYDASETWIFTLYTDDNQQYVPQNGSIVGLKSDGKTIANAGTVNGDGQVVIAETEQMTACAGINIFELILNGNHGTANFVVLVEPRPGDNATPSDSDLSLMQEAIEAASTVGTVGTLADKVTNLESQMEVWLTEHAGMSNETILWEGRLTGTGSVELSEDASQFDTIAVYTQATSYFEAGTASEAHYYKASDLIANHAVVSVAVASTVSSTAIQSAIITGVVGISGTQNKTFNLIDRKGLYWTGTATDDAGIILGSSDSALITKVVGIRNEQTDAEVVAARVGSDGTQYNNLKARLDAENSDLKSAFDDLEEQIGKSNSGWTEEQKSNLLALLRNLLYIGDVKDYYDAFEASLYPPTNLTRITAVYTQSKAVYPSDSLNSLKSDLVVTARYDDGSSKAVTAYTLSGNLTAGTSTITVSYGGKTTTFTVTVSESQNVLGYEVGGISSTDGSETTATNRVRTDYIPVSANDRILLTGGYKYGVRIYDSSKVYTGANTGGWITDSEFSMWTASSAGFIRLVIGKTTDADFTDGEIDETLLLTTDKWYAIGAEPTIRNVSVYTGKGTSGTSIIDTPNRALTEAFAISGLTAPVYTAWYTDDAEGQYTFKYIDSSNNIISSTTQAYPTTSVEMIWFQRSSPSVGVDDSSAYAPTASSVPSNAVNLRLLMAGADMSQPLSATPTGIIIINNMVIKLVEGNVNDFA